MQTEKPTVLTNFGYQRKYWTYPFESIKEDFNIIYIHYNRKEDEIARHTNEKVIYFSDYNNAQHLFDSIKPDIFIALGLFSNLSIAIRYTCKKRKIPYVYMDHGFYSEPEDYEEIRKLREKSKNNIKIDNIEKHRSSNYSFSIKTFLYSFSLLNLLFLITINAYKKISGKEMKQFQFLMNKIAKPDYLFTYSYKNSSTNRRYFNMRDDEIKVIGNFEFDQYLQKAKKQEPYALLIDSPFSDHPNGDNMITIEEHVKIYKKASLIANNKGLRLKIKLHPGNYNSNWIPKINNVEYVRENKDLNSLIKNAQIAFGFFGTAVIPAIYFVPTVIIEIFNHSLLRFLKENNICNVYKIEEFLNSEVVFAEKNEKGLEKYRQTYFNISEQSSIERFKNVIREVIYS